MLATKKSVGVTPEVNLRHPLCQAGKQEIYPGFETQGRCPQSLKQWCQGPKKGPISSKN